MQQSDIVELIGKHLDALADIIKWALLLALVFWWAGFEGTDSVEALGMKVPRPHALWVSVFVYIIVNVTVLVLILRVGDLLKLVDEAHLVPVLGRLALHPWPLNPFTHFGMSFVTRLHSGIGFGSLIVVWWVCNSSLYTFADQVRSPVALLLQGIFLAVGLASVQAINRVYGIVLQRTAGVDAALHSALLSSRVERLVFVFVGIGVGAFIAYVTQLARLLRAYQPHTPDRLQRASPASAGR
jgi:hypothetical protein